MLPTLPLSDGHLSDTLTKQYWDDGFLFPLPAVSPDKAQAARGELEAIEARWLDAGLPLPDVKLGEPMASDHRRILATAMGRLRGKIRYRPVIFELMPERFTLSALQMTCEGILGLKLHKQNFRRALDRTDLVEGTGEMMDRTGGRPAELYRFRREKLRRSAALGITTPAIRRDS